MMKKSILSIFTISSLFLLNSCSGGSNNITGGNQNNSRGIPIKFLAGSDLAQFCEQSAQKLNATKPKLSNGPAPVHASLHLAGRCSGLYSTASVCEGPRSKPR